MNPIMFRGNEHKRDYQAILREMEQERLFGQNSSKAVLKTVSGLGGILVAFFGGILVTLMAAGLPIG